MPEGEAKYSPEEAKEKLVYFAKKHLGKPYKYGASAYEAPKFFDCSSFLKYLYKRIGVDLPRTALDQASKGRKIEKNEKLEIGDLIFIKGGWGRYNPKYPGGIGHVAVYIGNGQVISASWKEEGGSVIEEKISNYLARDDFRIIKRIL